MRFLSIWKAVETKTPPSSDEMERMGQLIEKMSRDGTLIGTEGCLPSALGARVRRTGKRVTVTDGPFTESKELIAGFALLEADSKEHAIELCKRFMEVAGEGECELRQVYRAPADAEVAQQAAGTSHRA
jgi:hypothetical protein